jgi:hypothetical protein
MTNRWLSSLFLCCLLASAAGAQVRQYKSPSRYAIVYNDIVAETDSPKGTYRLVQVLLDERSFSEETLRELFSLLSKRFLRPRNLRVSVLTSLDQVETPEERDAPKISNMPDHPSTDIHQWAEFTRERGNEWYRYNVDPPGRKEKIVTLKGKSPPYE